MGGTPAAKCGDAKKACTISVAASGEQPQTLGNVERERGHGRCVRRRRAAAWFLFLMGEQEERPPSAAASSPNLLSSHQRSLSLSRARHFYLGELVHVVVAHVHVQAVGLPAKLVEREEEAAQD